MSDFRTRLPELLAFLTVSIYPTRKMRIRTKLRAGAGLSLSITLVICTVLFLASREVGRAVKQSSDAYGVVADVFELNLVLNDFLLRQGEKDAAEKDAAEWQSKHQALGKLLPTLATRTKGQQKALTTLIENHAKSLILFGKLLEGNREQRQNMDEIVGYLDLETKLMSELSAESKAMVSQARELAEMSNEDAVRAQHRTVVLVAAFTAVVTAVLAMTLIAVAGAVVKPITKLREATGRVAGGDLEHRVDVDSGDEIGELASDFNAMTARLKDSYVGMQNAFNEMARKLRNVRKELDDETGGDS